MEARSSFSAGGPARPLRVLVVEDEPLVRKDLRKQLEGFPSVECAGEAGTVEEAARLVPTAKPDVLFLDIELRRRSGFDLLPLLPATMPVVIVTAHAEYAVRAFEHAAIDYLLKPVQENRLSVALERLRKRGTFLEPLAAPAGGSPAIRVRSGPDWLRVPTSAIVAVLGDGVYSKILLDSGETLLVSTRLREWEEMLDPLRFPRLSRSVFVQLARIRAARFVHRSLSLVEMEGQAEPLALGRIGTSRLRRSLAYAPPRDGSVD